MNLCFNNGNDCWDNNNGNNYSFNIEKNSVALVVVDEAITKYPRKLRKSYLWAKKVKLAFYKFVRYFPKVVSGNYNKKSTNEN